MLQTQVANPVRGPVTYADALGEARTLQANMLAYQGEGGGYFDARVASGRAIVEVMDLFQLLDAEDEDADYRGYIYDFGGQPLGVMILSVKADHIYIDFLVTHPASSGCGGILVEVAARLSVTEGKQGLVRLTAADDAAARAYGPMGFVNEVAGLPEPANGPMRLNAATSALWANGAGGLTLARYNGSAYATGLP
jgi:hypothetical protein